jgi:transcriptional regulator with XRE-family HTH domain
MSKRHDYLPTKSYADVTPGQMLRIMRELQDMSQVDLARASGVTQTAISALERDRETLGIERARSLAAALRIHPAVPVFSDLAPVTKSPVPPSRTAKGSVRAASPAVAPRMPPTPPRDVRKVTLAIAGMKAAIDDLTAASAKAGAINVRREAQRRLEGDESSPESTDEPEASSTRAKGLRQRAPRRRQAFSKEA